MLVIRFQRTGRKGHAQFRVVVQDSRRTPTSGKIVAQVGTYNPHNKEAVLDKERAQHYLDHGAQPSDRVALLLKKEGVKLPSWVKLPAKQEGKIRNPEKLRRNQPEEVKEEAPAEEPAAEAEAPDEEAAETPVEEAAPEETPAE
jgi:small subunit ribosomal protein S16